MAELKPTPTSAPTQAPERTLLTAFKDRQAALQKELAKVNDIIADMELRPDAVEELEYLLRNQPLLEACGLQRKPAMDLLKQAAAGLAPKGVKIDVGQRVPPPVPAQTAPAAPAKALRPQPQPIKRENTLP